MTHASSQKAGNIKKSIVSKPIGCVCLNMRMAMRSVTKMYDAELKPAGIKITQFSLLAAIDGSSDISITQLAKFLGLDRTTLSRNLGPLEREGYVHVSSEGYQRIRTMSLTPKGKAKLDEAMPLWRKAQKKILKTIGEDNWLDMMGQLKAMEAV